MNFTGNLDCAVDTTISSFLKKQKKVFLTFEKELWEYCKYVVLWFNLSNNILKENDSIQ